MKKQPQVRERTREKMFDAFFKEYKENTLRGVTVGAVSRRANVNRSTFYEYFTDIYDLIDQAEDSLLTEMLSRIMQLQKEGFNVHSRRKGLLSALGGLHTPIAARRGSGASQCPPLSVTLRRLHGG